MTNNNSEIVTSFTRVTTYYTNHREFVIMKDEHGKATGIWYEEIEY